MRMIDSGRRSSSVEDPTRLLFVSRNRLFRDCLASQLGLTDRFEVTAQADELSDGIRKARRQEIRLLLVDGNGLDDSAFDLLAGLDGDMRTVVLGLRGVATEVRRYAAAGISGFAYRDTPFDELTRTLSAVARGERVCAADCTHDLFARLARLGRAERRTRRMEVLNLTSRQMEVLRLIAKGLGNGEIASRLSLSANTIKNHVHNILERMDARDRAEAVARAYERHWLP